MLYTSVIREASKQNTQQASVTGAQTNATFNRASRFTRQRARVLLAYVLR